MFKGNERSIATVIKKPNIEWHEKSIIEEAKYRNEIIVRVSVKFASPLIVQYKNPEAAIANLEKKLPVIKKITNSIDNVNIESIVLFLLAKDYFVARTIIRQQLASFSVSVDEVPFDQYDAIKHETLCKLENDNAIALVNDWKNDLVSLLIKVKTIASSLEHEVPLYQKSENLVNEAQDTNVGHISSLKMNVMLYRYNGMIYGIPEYSVIKIEKHQEKGFWIHVTMQKNGVAVHNKIKADSLLERQKVLLSNFVFQSGSIGQYKTFIGPHEVIFIPPYC